MTTALKLTDYQRDVSRWTRAREVTFDGVAIGETDDGEAFADILVLFFYTASERACSDYPGCPAELEIAGVYDKHTGAAIEMDDCYCESVYRMTWNYMEGR